MRSDVMGMVMPINEKDLKELMKETKETLDVDVNSDDSKRTFGSLDLWNLQKKQRTMGSMRRWLN